MSTATVVFLIGMFIGGFIVFTMMSIIITASKADERDRILFNKYLRDKKYITCSYKDIHGELPKCKGQCWECFYADACVEGEDYDV